MSRFWLTYCHPSGRLLGVVIIDSWHIIEARQRARLSGELERLGKVGRVRCRGSSSATAIIARWPGLRSRRM